MIKGTYPTKTITARWRDVTQFEVSVRLVFVEKSVEREQTIVHFTESKSAAAVIIESWNKKVTELEATRKN